MPAYRVEVEACGCQTCGEGHRYNIVGPDEAAISVSFEDRQDAEDMADQLEIAYELGARSLSASAKQILRDDYERELRKDAAIPELVDVFRQLPGAVEALAIFRIDRAFNGMAKLVRITVL